MILPALEVFKGSRFGHYAAAIEFEDKIFAGQISIPSIRWDHDPSENIDPVRFTQFHGMLPYSNGDRIMTYPGVEQEDWDKKVKAQFLFDGVTDPANKEADSKFSFILEEVINELLVFNPETEIKFNNISSTEDLEQWIVNILHPALMQKCEEQGVVGRATGAIAVQNIERNKLFVSVWGDSSATFYQKNEAGDAVEITQVAVPNQDKWNRATLFLGTDDTIKRPYFFGSYKVKFNGPNPGDPGVIGYPGFSRNHIVSANIDMTKNTFVALTTDGVSEMAEVLKIQPYMLINLLVDDSFTKLGSPSGFYFSNIQFLRKLSLYGSCYLQRLLEKRKKVDDLSIGYLGNFFQIPYITNQEDIRKTLEGSIRTGGGNESLISNVIRQQLITIGRALIPEACRFRVTTRKYKGKTIKIFTNIP